MQLAQNAAEAFFRPYNKGEIVLASASSGTADRLYRGTLVGVRIMDGDWLDVELTCNEYATGGLEDADNADLLWTPSSGGITHALLYADVTVDDDTNTLHLHKETPQGATAIMKLPLAASTAKAA